VIHPIVLLVSYTFVFSVIFGLRPLPDTGTTSFPLFLFCSILPWLFFQDAAAIQSVLIENANLITKTLFPSEILPLVVLLSGLVNHLIGFAILAGHPPLHPGQDQSVHPFCAVYFFFADALYPGISWFVSSLNVFVRMCPRCSA